MSEPFWTPEQFAAYLRNFGKTALGPPPPAPSTSKPKKYRAQPKIVDSIRFDSTKEADRYSELKLLRQAGAIRDLELQPRFDLVTSAGDVVGAYVADFRYVVCDTDRIVIEDTKSAPTMTPLYRLKKKIAESCHKITITEL